MTEQTKTRQPVSISDCDKNVAEWWRKLRDDPKSDPDVCRQQIDQWLDARLLIMVEGEAERMED